MSGGRPTKYRAEYADQVFKLCLLGHTDEEIADFLSVTVSTLHLWAAKHPEFSEARKSGKQDADANVARSLYHRALGYEHPAVKILSFEGHSWEHAYVERYPPDTGAAMAWLKNRQPKLWRDRHEFEHSGPNGGPIETREVSDADLQKRATELANRIAPFMHATNGNGNGKHSNGKGA